MTPALTIIIAMTLPHTETVQERCDVIERNVYFDTDTGTVEFDQHIFWRFNAATCRLEVIDWRKFDGQSVRIHHENGHAYLLWHDGSVVREMRAPLTLETYSDYDREVEDRYYFPMELRKKLLVK